MTNLYINENTKIGVQLSVNPYTGGSSIPIPSRFVHKFDYNAQYGEVQNCAIELIAYKDKFNYLKDEQFKGILNNRGTTIDINIVKDGNTDFIMKGIVNTWGMTADTSDYTIVRIEMIDRNTDINNSILRGADVSALGTIYDQAADLNGDSTDRDLGILKNSMEKIKSFNPDFNYRIGTPSTTDYGTTTRPPSSSSNSPSSPSYGEWEPIIGNFHKLIPNATNIEAGITKQGYMIISYLPTYQAGEVQYHKLMIIDLNTMRNVTIEMNMHRAGLKGDGTSSSSNSARLAVNEQGNDAVLCFGNPYTMYHIDLDSKEITKLDTLNQIGEPFVFEDGSQGYLSNAYFVKDQLIIFSRVYVTGNYGTGARSFSIRGKKATLDWTRQFWLGIEYQLEGFYSIVSGNFIYMKRTRRRELNWNITHLYDIIRLSDGLSTLNENDLVFPNWSETLPFLSSNQPRSMNVFGYTMIFGDSSYMIIDPVEQTVEPISVRTNSNIYNVPKSGRITIGNTIYTFDKHTAYYKGYVYLIPTRTSNSIINTYNTSKQKASFSEVIRTRVKFKNDGIDQNGVPTSYFVDQSTNQAFQDYINYNPSIPSPEIEAPKYNDLMNEAYDMSNYTIPALPSAGVTNADLLKDLADNTGMEFYSVGNIVVFETPEVKEVEDHVLDTRFSAEPLEHVKSATIYSSVKIYYGRGSSAGVVQIFRDENVYAGESASVYEQIRPTMSKAQAENYARRILKNGIKEEILISFPYVPNLKVGHTVRAVSQRLLGGSYKGVCTAMSLSISASSGAYGHYTLTDYS